MRRRVYLIYHMCCIIFYNDIEETDLLAKQNGPQCLHCFRYLRVNHYWFHHTFRSQDFSHTIPCNNSHANAPLFDVKSCALVNLKQICWRRGPFLLPSRTWVISPKSKEAFPAYYISEIPQATPRPQHRLHLDL
jgi:hypothetical protein